MSLPQPFESLKAMKYIAVASIFIFFQAAAERPSLAKLSLSLQNGDAITQAYKSEKTKDYNKLIGSNKDLRRQFIELVRGSAGFVRGEIEQEGVMNFLTQMVQLSILNIRQLAQQNKGSEVFAEAELWFIFSADLSYEETTLIGMRLAHVLRALVLDEIEKIFRHSPEIFLTAANKFQSLRAPWPIDRMLLYESRRVLSGVPLKLAEKVALEIQKNPYQTTEDILQKMNASQNKDLAFLKQLWRKQDLEMMKNEMNRLGRLPSASLWVDFQKKNKKAPRSWQDLKISPPIDYNSGKPMSWDQLSSFFATEQKVNKE